MSVLHRLLPQPIVTLMIIALWMGLATSLSLGNLLLGTVLGFVIPWFTRSFWPGRPRLVRPLLGLALFVRVLADILIANWEVALLVIGPIDRLKPAFVTVPLDTLDPFVATVLGSIVSLTPGTVSIEIDMGAKALLVHALNVGDDAQLVATIKTRYEAPLKEIFGC
ncbi:MAG: Na+/H+ antiporter subunit E [Hyphomicrobiaceae bacterium]